MKNIFWGYRHFKPILHDCIPKLKILVLSTDPHTGTFLIRFNFSCKGFVVDKGNNRWL